ncbi:PilZ domain-containing protein [candidate division FCPU426 bacterium]|nr:PilZ domain-containing protein [candidate division FCPU426 bacterium]
MKKQRGSDVRVKVDLPITFTYEDDKTNRKIVSRGRIDNMSINGMQVDIPLSSEIIETNYLDFDLELPNPFVKIRGFGKIKWKRWNADKNCTTCGLMLEPMSLSQLTDLDVIIDELAKEIK